MSAKSDSESDTITVVAVHVWPLPTYPLLQVHANDPAVFVQSALAWHVSVLSVHSLMSVHSVLSPPPDQPAAQLQVNLVLPLVQADDAPPHVTPSHSFGQTPMASSSAFVVAPEMHVPVVWPIFTFLLQPHIP
jgi:hypothetical protein